MFREEMRKNNIEYDVPMDIIEQYNLVSRETLKRLKFLK